MVRKILPQDSSVNAFGIHQDDAVDFLDWKHLKRFFLYRAGTGFQAELVTVHRTNDLAVAEQSFGQRAKSVRTSIVSGEYFSIALAEYGERLTANDVTASLPQWDGGDTTKIDNRCEYFFSHYFLQPPMRTLIRVH